MTNHVITYILLLFASLVVSRTPGKGAIRKYVRLSFFFCTIWSLHLIFCSLHTAHSQYAVSMLHEASMLSFVFVPAYNIYPRHRFDGPHFKTFDWNYLREVLLKFISNIKTYLEMNYDFSFIKSKAENGLHHSALLTTERVSLIEKRVSKHFEENRPYLQTGYSLQMLSEETQISVHHLSAFVNQCYKINFNNFINEHRVVICVEKLLQKEWETKKLEAIAQECGFNNRNTFTSAFKKTTGLNPSEFLKQIKQKKSNEERKYLDKEKTSFQSADSDQLPRENIA